MHSNQINIPLSLINPNREGVLKSQGIPQNIDPPPRIKELYNIAESLFFKHAAPTAIQAPISIETFTQIYRGQGNNEPKTPLENIFSRADHLALFAFTLGPAISNEIESRFKSNNLAVAYMLDSIASYCTDQAGKAAANFFASPPHTYALLYSPGYCGWHISGQKELFNYLKPETIGITLNDRFLMVPLKSISGVLVSGKKEIHFFKNHFPFCATCISHSCIERQKSL